MLRDDELFGKWYSNSMVIYIFIGNFDKNFDLEGLNNNKY